MPEVDEATARLDRAIEQLSGSSAVALRVLEAVDHPMSTAASVAAAVEVDPVLLAHVLRVANSAAFGAMSTVSTAARAVPLLGLPTVRSLAAATAVQGVNRNAPARFWEHSAAAAGGCVAVSSAFGVARDEAFSMGLMHDLGWAVLDLVDAPLHERLRGVGVDSAALCEAEVAEFGVGHDHLAARVLTGWNFPRPIVDAIGLHHGRVPAHGEETTAPPVEITAHGLVLAAGDALAHRLVEGPDATGGDGLAELSELGFSPEAVDSLLELTSAYMADILDATTA